jgi:hypothetical protein
VASTLAHSGIRSSARVIKTVVRTRVETSSAVKSAPWPPASNRLHSRRRDASSCSWHPSLTVHVRIAGWTWRKRTHTFSDTLIYIYTHTHTHTHTHHTHTCTSEESCRLRASEPSLSFSPLEEVFFLPRLAACFAMDFPPTCCRGVAPPPIASPLATVEESFCATFLP